MKKGQAEDDRQIENGAYANMQQVEEEDGEQRSEKRARDRSTLYRLAR